MKQILLSLIALISSLGVYGQSSGDLNDKAKELLKSGDTKKAVHLLQKAAELGNAEAQYNYGICFQQGVEVNQSDKTANEWFLKSASQGWRDAQFKVAFSYATGRGLVQDKQKAFYWSLKCAEQDDPECMFNVISCYMEGFGTDKNIDSMEVWAQRLASMETPEDLKLSGQITSARLQLAQMYEVGKPISKDLVKSYTWYLLYNESKHDFSVLEQQQTIGHIKELEKKLTKEQLAISKKDAEQIVNRPLRNIANLYKQDL